MVTLLTLEGAVAVGAASAAEALAVSETQDFDLVLSDIGMPGMDGIQLIAELKRRPRTANWPAIAVSGFTATEDVARARAAGFAGFVGKPFSIEDLNKVVGEVLPSALTRS